MIITLPNNFTYKGRGYSATMENGILKLRGRIYFEQLMYSLAHEICKGNVCEYCKHRIEGTCTIDHIYPRCMGGVSITNNMAITCRKCNEEKDCLTLEEYRIFLTLDDSSKKKYKKSIASKNEKVKRKSGFKLPKEWIAIQDINSIICKNKKALEMKGKQYKRIEMFYKKYQRLPRPVIVDKNNIIIDGIAIYCFALNNKVNNISTIVLENVEVIK